MSEDMHDEFAQEEYKVGYQKPPKHTQFQKGVSGNPSGRPKKAPDFDSQLLRELDSKMSITENGKRKIVSKATVIFKQMTNRASNGHLPTQRTVLPLYWNALVKRAEEQQRALDLANRPLDESLIELTDAQLLFIATRGGTMIPELPLPEPKVSSDDKSIEDSTPNRKGRRARKPRLP